MALKARHSRRSPAQAPEVITWTRADPAALADFDPRSKSCTMNCGKHALDPRSAVERKFLCDDCEPCRPSVHEQLRDSLAREAALRAELEQLRAVTRNALLPYHNRKGLPPMSMTPERKAEAVAKLRAALDPIRLADTDAERINALGSAQGYLFALWRLEDIDRATFDDLLVEIMQADGEGVRRCEAKRT